MLSSDILDVAIGIVFVFVLISTICSAVREGLEAWLKTRAAYLEHAIQQLLNDKDGTGLAQALFNHPLISVLFSGDYKPRKALSRPTLMRGGRNLPSYIPSRNFALALLDIAAHGPVPPPGSPAPAPSGSPAPAAPFAPAESVLSLAQIRARVEHIGNHAVRRALLVAIDGASGDINRAVANIEAWYDSTMERVSGWYKRSTQWVLFWIAVILVIGLNINTLAIADYLYRHPSQRSAIIATMEHTTPGTAAYAVAERDLEEMHLPLGWDNGWASPLTPEEFKRAHAGGAGIEVPYFKIRILPWEDVLQRLIGWLLTIFAASMGAPFWFDVLNKLSSLRSTAKPRVSAAPEPFAVSPYIAAPPPVPAVIAAQQVPHPSPRPDPGTHAAGSAAPAPEAPLPAAPGGVA